MTVGRAAARWSRTTFTESAYLSTGAAIGVAATAALTGPLSVLLSLSVTAVLPVPFANATVRLTRRLTDLQRTRHRIFFGVRLAPFPPDSAVTGPRDGWRRPLGTRLISRPVWRQIGCHLLSCLICVAGFLLALLLWVTGFVLVTLPLTVWVLPVRPVPGLHPQAPAAVLSGSAAGLACLLAASWVTRGAAALDVRSAKALLQPSGADQLAVLGRRVEELAASRSAAVQASDQERRRIERDLHDGAQQSLVSLAMNLGLIRMSLPEGTPDSLREAVRTAHDDAKRALTELRDLVRGLHPAVLDELGLDAALSGIAARSPVPVTLRIDLPHRPPKPVEAIAYFVVSEALTNVAKHAEARRVVVSVEHGDPHRLSIAVTDDGRGGAVTGGGGLSGLRHRVGTVDGTMRIDSPVGGPTVLSVELPCAS
ncbi:sensor histidine kinase [Actinomadura rubrisoli]|uniref:histidine kinase n=2 Tax=Actinomadura rubrisoli TaxID=2530368 RepID=A0A4R5C5B7_9ACTN|nr:sensor histidine kinase [Actinomadura rubrisoli]